MLWLTLCLLWRKTDEYFVTLFCVTEARLLTPPMSAPCLTRGVPDVSVQAVVILEAGRAPVQVRTQPGNRRIGIGSGQFELDVAIERVKALLARDLWSDRPENASEALTIEVGAVHAVSP